MPDLPPAAPARRVLVLVAPTREATEEVARTLVRRLRARVLTPDRCTCPMSLRALGVHSVACPRVVDAA